VEINSIFDEPTLFIRGANSNYIQAEDESVILSHFAKAKIETIQNAGHWVHAEQPQKLLDLVINFLKD